MSVNTIVLIKRTNGNFFPTLIDQINMKQYIPLFDKKDILPDPKGQLRTCFKYPNQGLVSELQTRYYIVN